MTEDLERLRERLLEAAFLFDHPPTYRAGVEDTLAAVGSLLGAGDGQRSTA